MTMGLRRLAWPLGVSLAAHALLGAWCWLKPAAPRPAVVARAAPLSMRLVPAAPAAAPAAASVVRSPAMAAVNAPRRVAVAKPRPAAPAPEPPPVERLPEPQAEVAAAPAAATPASAAVTGVAFGPPRLGLPFGASARSGWMTRPAATASAMPAQAMRPPSNTAEVTQRQQLLDALARQVAAWTAPESSKTAHCRVSVHEEGERTAQCDPPALADALAQGLATLRDGWSAYRRLTPEAPLSVDVAYADGHFSLSTPPR